MSRRRSGRGRPFPLGPDWDGDGTNFSLFSENAERVELCLFDEHGGEERIELHERTAFNWHCYLPGVGPGQRYGYRVHGPYDPKTGQPLQRREAADRPVREGDRRARSTGAPRTRCRTCPGGGEDADLSDRRDRLRAGDPAVASSSTRRSTGRTTTGRGRARPGTRP